MGVWYPGRHGSAERIGFAGCLEHRGHQPVRLAGWLTDGRGVADGRCLTD